VSINEFQSAVLTDYADGDFAFLKTRDETDIGTLRDGLLKFILIELSTEEDCDSVNTAIDRLTLARDDIDVCLGAMIKIQKLLLNKI